MATPSPLELRDSASHIRISLGESGKALRIDGPERVDKGKLKVRRVRESWPEQLRKYESQGRLDGH